MVTKPGKEDPAEYGGRIADVYDRWHLVGSQVEEIGAVVDFPAERAGDGPVLELGIGTGRIALPLAARGIPVAGIDASERMVGRLRAKPGGAELPVTIGDFADIDVPGGSFSLVYVVFSTFFALLTQADQERCFASAAARLRPGGVFILEAFVPELSLFDRGQDLRVTTTADDETRLNTAILDRSTQRIHSRHIAITDHGIDTYLRWSCATPGPPSSISWLGSPAWHWSTGTVAGIVRPSPPPAPSTSPLGAGPDPAPPDPSRPGPEPARTRAGPDLGQPRPGRIPDLAHLPGWAPPETARNRQSIQSRGQWISSAVRRGRSVRDQGASRSSWTTENSPWSNGSPGAGATWTSRSRTPAR